MCGIAVIAGGNRLAEDGAMERMVANLRHRGPDAEGIDKRHYCHVGHTRLQIIDPVGGHQPMWDERRRYCLTFNGEIYNFRDIRKGLEKRGCTFRSSSDTEVLLQAFVQYGSDVVDHLNGQFAFAVWDDQERRLFAARDRLGEKPLFWARTPGGGIVAASEIRALLAAGLVDPQLDDATLDFYLTFIYVPPDRTVYKNVHCLPPAHTLQWQDGQVTQRCYWTPRFAHAPVDLPEAVTHTRTLIERAVERQMVADTTVGAFLSGGLDSSTIVALMSKLTSVPVKTFSVGFGDLINELPYARAVARRYGTDHAEMQMDIPVGEMLEKMADVYDEPFGDSSNIPTYLVAEFARRHVKVVLSGDGGDEVFGGYSWYRPLLEVGQASGASRALAFAAVKGTSVLARLGMPVARMRERWQHRHHHHTLQKNYPDLWDRHLAALTIQTAESRRKLWQRPGSFDDSMLRHFRPEATLQGIDRGIFFDVRCYLPGDIFVKVDRAAMAHGLETRSPFMDVELLTFVLGLPGNLRFHQSTLKYLLKASCADLWPKELTSRAKQGFGAPIAAWLERPDVQKLLERVFQPESPLVQLLPGALSMRGRGRVEAQAVWNLLCLGLWLEKRTSCLRHLRLAS